MRNKIIAPTDPKFKGKYFYLYRDLKFEAVLRDSGRRTTENYLDGRIKSAVRINGGIEDENILGMFDNVKSTQELIKGVGVEITADSDNEKFGFCIIFYGKNDRLNGGTHIKREVASNGVEVYIDFSEVDFSDDDEILGQLEIEFPDSLDVATMSVKIYVDEKYDIPAQVDEDEVDITSDAYTDMIKSSIVSTGNNERFLNAVEKAKAGKDVTIAFIGGSITQGAGAVPSSTECYAYKTYAGFKKLIEKEAGKECADNLRYVRAGIGGTPSELGVVRYDKDVRDFGKIEPDIVVVEFAVNDEGDETNGDCYEGLMRKIWNNANRPALILLFSIFADDWNLQDRFIPIGEKYGVPMISVKNAVLPQFGKTSGDGAVSKRQYFYDIFHPSNIGHTIMADCVTNYFNEAVKMPLSRDIDDPPYVRSDDFDNVIYFDRKYTIDGIDINCGSFLLTDADLQSVERDFDNFLTPCFPDNWMHEAGKTEPFTLKLRCRLLMVIIKDTFGTDFGVIDIFVDGKKARSYDPKEIGWVHCNAVIVLREKEVKDHTIEIVMAKEDTDKYATILGFGYAI